MFRAIYAAAEGTARVQGLHASHDPKHRADVPFGADVFRCPCRLAECLHQKHLQGVNACRVIVCIVIVCRVIVCSKKNVCTV